MFLLFNASHMIFLGFILKHITLTDFILVLVIIQTLITVTIILTIMLDDNLADFDESVNFFNFSVDMSLNQLFKALHQEKSRSSSNRHFDKQQRKRSYRRSSHKSDDRLHPTHHPIDLSSRTYTPIDEINLLSKGPSFCPMPRDTNWHKCRQDWQALSTKCDEQTFTLIVNILIL